MVSNQERYREICNSHPEIPVFSQAWWLDTIQNKGEWDVVIIEKNNILLATMPYFVFKGFVYTELKMPDYTQTLGPYLFYPPNQSYTKKLRFEKKVMTMLIDALPRYDYFHQYFHYSITNWLPFYWKGFVQTSRYTYVLEDLTNLDRIFQNFSLTKRQNIQKAETLVLIKFDLPSDKFYDLHKKSLALQNKKISYSYNSFKKKYDEGYKRNRARTLYAIDQNDNIHSALFIIWDDQSAYTLIGPIDPKFRNSGSFTLLTKEAIKFASTVTKKFDFEGSMIEGVENSYNQFGGTQKQFFTIKKYNSFFIRAKYFLKDSIYKWLKESK